MTTFYADNFRGFSDTYVELTNVNFFVGENSSGKTSMLSLIQFLSNQEYWFGPAGLNRGTRLGHFSDAVSAHTEDKSCFRLGVVSYSKSDRNAEAISGYSAALLTFKNKDGLPAISDYICQVGRLGAKFQFTGMRTTVQTREDLALPSDPLRPFGEWKTPNFFSGRAIQVKGAARQAPLIFLFLLATSFKDGKKNQAIKLDPSDVAPWMRQWVWLAPIRTKPKRTYDDYRLEFSAEGEHTPYLIRKLLSTRSRASHFQEFIAKFGRESGLFESVKIKRHGRGETAPFELDIVLSSQALGVNNVGYGVSQSLPIVVELFARSKGAAFAIQQPEVHLHPTAQAALGDVIYELAVSENKEFCVETHSDYLIDRFRLRQSKARKASRSQILYFVRNERGNSVCSIGIGDDGRLAENYPEGYRRFFVNEAMQMLGLG